MSRTVDANRSSIVAYYDGLPAALAELITGLHQTCADLLGSTFVARPPEQIHATIIGLETAPPGTTAADRARFDARPLVEHVVEAFLARPLDVQFGGFDVADRRLRSRGTSLHDRSLVISPSQVVLVGWPVGGDGDGRPVPLPALAELRRGCEAFGVRHRYHLGPGDEDPDAYLVIGRISDADTRVDQRRRADAGHAIRRDLAKRASARVPMRAEHLRLVSYDDTTLPPSSTRHRPLLGF